ncbi:MAG: hypothetical protein JXR90_14155 [Spirochaetes bacterium]|nr:hypothetical protein [Spirochaetota bacterium]
MKKKIIIIILIITVIGALIYWKRDAIKKKLGMSSEEPEASPTNQAVQENNISPNVLPPVSKSDYVECNRLPYKRGCKGKNVLTIQKLLNKKHKAGLTEDGYFGAKTEAALVANGYGPTVENEDLKKLLANFFSS